MRIFQLIFIIIVFIFSGVSAVACTGVVSDLVREGNASSDDLLLLMIYGACITALFELIRWKAGKKLLILHMIWIDLLIMLLNVAAVGAAEKDMEVAVGGIIIAALSGIIPAAVCYSVKQRKKKDQQNAPVIPDWRFKRFSSEWMWDDTENEYRTLKGISQEAELTDDQNNEIWVYCCSYFSYLFAWLVRHDHIDSEMISEQNMDELQGIKDEKNDPAEVLCSCFDGKLVRNDISDEIIGFIDRYYEVKYSDHTYEKEYESIVRKDSGREYCLDFSWDIYREFEQVIDRHYSYYQRELYLDEYDYDGWLYGEDHSETFGLDFEIRVQSAGEERLVSDEYVNKCTEHMKHFPQEMLSRICSCINEWNYEVSEEDFSSHISDVDITVLRPYGEEPAYIIGFEADFEEEHGVSVVIRGDRILDTGYRSDWTSPWSEENDKKYYNVQK